MNKLFPLLTLVESDFIASNYAAYNTLCQNMKTSNPETAMMDDFRAGYTKTTNVEARKKETKAYFHNVYEVINSNVTKFNNF